MKYVFYLVVLFFLLSGCEEFSVKNIKCSETDKCPNGYFCNSSDKCVTNCSEDSECRNGFKCDLALESPVCKEFCDSETGGCADGFYCFENKCVTCDENQKYSYFHKKCMSDCNEGEANGKERYEGGICVCDNGYSNEYHCPDIDECYTNTHNCQTGYSCENTIGSFNCLNIDECSNNSDNCSDNARCTDSEGLFSCECKSGYTGNGVDCIDINECENGTHNCETGFECENTEGTFECNDINECLLELDNCEIWENCINTSGAFECSNINECANEIYPCAEKAACTDTSSGYECKCIEGYEGDGFTCTDINECENNTHNCSETENCINTESSFNCVCKSGYERNGSDCEDINECQRNLHNCTNGYSCENTIGSFICNDINECLNETDNCPLGYECENTIASFECNEYCGNGIRTTNESCDGSNLNNNTCTSLNYSAGNLICSDECQFVTTDCRKTFMVGTEFEEYYSRIIFDANGNLYIAGTTKGGLNGNANVNPLNGTSDVFLMKYNTNNVLEWTKQFGTDQEDKNADITVDEFGNIFIIGTTLGKFETNPNQAGYDVFIAKYSSSGEKLWVRQLGTVGGEGGYSIKYKNNHLYIIGNTSGAFENFTNAGETDIFIGKLSSNYGEIVWIKQTGSLKIDKANSLTIDSENNIYIAGNTEGSFNGTNNSCLNNCEQDPNSYIDTFIIKYNSSGDLIWIKQFGTPTNDTPSQITVDNLNNIYIIGNTSGNFDENINNCGDNCSDFNSLSDVYLVKYDYLGNKLWSKQIGTDRRDISAGLYVDLDRNIYIVGGTIGNFDTFTNECLTNCTNIHDLFFIKYNNIGNQEFVKQWGTSLNDIAEKITKSNTGKIFISGYSRGNLDENTNKGSTDLFITSFEPQ